MSKVRSRDSETTLRDAPTTPSCSKRARRPSSTPEAGAEALDEQLGRRGAHGRERRQPQLTQARGGLRPDPRHEARARPAKARAGLLAREHDEARRLLGVGGDLRDELVRADAHRAGQLRGPLDLREQPAHRRARRVQAREIQIGLVETDHLDALDVRAHDAHDLRGDLAVGREVRRQEHRLRAQPPRARGGHRRADAVAPRLIAGGRHDRARAAPGDDHGPPAQLRMAAQLDRDVEGVAVDVRRASFL